MAIPDYQAIMLPLLNCLEDKQDHTLSDIYEGLCEYFELTPDEKSQLQPSGNQGVMRNRVGWARTYLKKAGLLLYPQRGFMQITPRGLTFLEDK